MKTAPLLSISGTVTGTAGPLDGVRVALTSTTHDEQGTTTGADGSFSFTGLPRGGDFVLTATRDGFAFTPPSHQYVPLTGSVAGVTFSGAALRISGRTLRTGATPTPVGGCLVELVDPDGGQQLTTSDPTTGRYAFASGLQTGHSYTVQGSKDGYTPVFGPQPVGSLESPVERDLYFTADPNESVVTTWLLPILGILSPPGVAALGWSIYTYLKPNLPAPASAADVEAAAGALNVGQAADAAAANNALSQAGAAAAKSAAGDATVPLSQAPQEAAQTLVANAETQVADNVAQRVVATLSDAGSSSAQVLQDVGSIGTEEMPAVLQALGQAEDSTALIARLKAVFDTAIDWPPADAVPAEAIPVTQSGWVGAVSGAADAGVGASVDAANLGELLPEAGEAIEEVGLSVEAVADVLVGVVVAVM